MRQEVSPFSLHFSHLKDTLHGEELCKTWIQLKPNSQHDFNVQNNSYF